MRLTPERELEIRQDVEVLSKSIVVGPEIAKIRELFVEINALRSELVHVKHELKEKDARIYQKLLPALVKISKNNTDDREIYTMGCDCHEVASAAIGIDDHRAC